MVVIMKDEMEFYVVRKKAVPDILLKVMEAKRLLLSGKSYSVAEACDIVNIARSSFYKYKDDIMPFYDNENKKVFNVSVQMDDQKGVLSEVLSLIAKAGGNILTIHQSIPIHGIASLSISIKLMDGVGEISDMMQRLEEYEYVHRAKILDRLDVDK